MRFFISSKILALVSFFLGSVAVAQVKNFNGMIRKVTSEERSLRQKFLEQVPDSEVAQAYHASWVKMEKDEAAHPNDISVRLTKGSD